MAQGDDAGTGERGHVDDRRRLEALGVGEGVAQHQPALGVGIEDLDRLARHRGDDVARACGRTRRHVLGGRDDHRQVDLELHLRHGLQGAEHRARAGHVVLHLVHIGGRLERNAAGVEGDALAHQDDRGLACAGATVVHDDELGRLRRTLRHGQQGTHAQRGHLLLIQHLDLELELAAQLLGLAGQEGRVADVGRLVAQVAGGVDAIGQVGHPRHAGCQGLLVGRAFHAQHHVLQGRGGFGLALVVVKAVAHLTSCQHDLADTPGQLAQFDVGLVQAAEGVGGRRGQHGAEGAAHGLGKAGGLDGVFMAHRDQQDARQTLDAGGHQLRGTGLLAQVAGLQDGRECVVQAGVDGCAGGREPAGLHG